MKEVKIETTLQVYDSISNLPEDVQQLMNSAIEARKHAYSPYSKFDVGAAPVSILFITLPVAENPA